MSDYNAYLKRMQARADGYYPTLPPAPVTEDRSFDAIFDLCDDGSNFVPFTLLRDAMGGSKEEQDRTITSIRASGRYTLSPCDRFANDAMIATQYTDSHGDTFHYISRRDS